MSVIHYFSSDANIRAKFMFNFIAPIYGKVDGALVKSYSKSIELLDNESSGYWNWNRGVGCQIFE